MSPATSFLLATLLLPCAALAQDLPPVTEPAAAQEGVAAPPLVQAPEDTPAATPAASETQGSFLKSRRGRVLVGTLSGAAGAVVGGAIGGTLSLKQFAGCGSFPGTVYCGDSLVPFHIGVAGGSGLGVYTSSRLLGGKGGLFLTMLGAGLGTVPFALLVNSEPRIRQPWQGKLLFAGLLLPTAGALLFNEISHATSEAEPAPVQPRKAPGFLVAPTVGATPRGEVMGGLVGRF